MVKIINADILKFNIEKLCDDKTSIVGNLPYNISLKYYKDYKI